MNSHLVNGQELSVGIFVAHKLSHFQTKRAVNWQTLKMTENLRISNISEFCLYMLKYSSLLHFVILIKTFRF